MKKINTMSLNNFLKFKFMMKNLFIAFAFALMLINPSISIAAESPVDVQEVF